jgi:hypothetical protein
MTVSFTGNQGVSLLNGDENSISAHANFGQLMSDGGNYAIGTHNGGYGTTVDFSTVFSTPKNITVSTASNNWTHAFTGYYAMHFGYRQQSGGDAWVIYAVTKDGNQNAVGTTARMGSEDGKNESFHMIYKVDSTTSNYRLQGYCYDGVTRNITTTDASYPAGWTSSVTNIGSGNPTGKVLDIIIYRIGGL